MEMQKKAVMPGRDRTSSPVELERLIADLAAFRYSLRKFVRFSEMAARSYEITPQQHQLMLGVAGFTGRGSATISELAEFLQARLHSVVGLVERAEQRGLVRAKKSAADRRVVMVSLTRRGSLILERLSEIHDQQARSLRLFMDNNRLDGD
ncbi:MAG: MarR family transcriptional regulator [Acidobacteriaceae bacterium]